MCFYEAVAMYIGLRWEGNHGVINITSRISPNDEAAILSHVIILWSSKGNQLKNNR
jgi:hypothetical protein